MTNKHTTKTEKTIGRYLALVKRHKMKRLKYGVGIGAAVATASGAAYLHNKKDK